MLLEEPSPTCNVSSKGILIYTNDNYYRYFTEIIGYLINSRS